MGKTIYIDPVSHGGGPVVALLVADENGEPVEMARAGLELLPQAPDALYDALRDHCGLDFCTYSGDWRDYPFYPVPYMRMFATDRRGGYYCGMGDCGMDRENQVPIAYISPDGKPLVVAGNLRDFMTLVFFYPDWQKALDGEPVRAAESYPAELAEQLGLVRDDTALDKLVASAKREPPRLYASREEARAHHLIVAEDELTGEYPQSLVDELERLSGEDES